MAQKQFQDHDRTRHLPLLLTITGPVPERIPVAAGQELVWRTKPVASARLGRGPPHPRAVFGLLTSPEDTLYGAS